MAHAAKTPAHSAINLLRTRVALWAVSGNGGWCAQFSPPHGSSRFASELGNLDEVQVKKNSSSRAGLWTQLLSGTAVGIAGFVLTLALTAVILSAVVAGLDPLVNVTTALVGLGSVGLMALLAVTALAIPIFFLKRHIVSFPTSIAPAAGGVMIAVAVCMAFANYSAVTGVDSVFVNHLPYLLIVVASIGAVQAQWIRWQRPDLYVRIGASRVDEAVGGCEPVES